MPGQQLNPKSGAPVFLRQIELELSKLRNMFTRTSARGKVVTATYDLTTASGAQDIVGFGFTPKSGFISAGVNGDSAFSMGMFDAAAMHSVADASETAAGTFAVSTAATVRLLTAAGAHQSGVVTIIPDGIRITWTKTGSPTGTALIGVHAFP